MRYSRRSIVVCCTVIVTGIFLARFGCACYIKANSDPDPVTALIQGLGKILHVSLGTITNVLNASVPLILLAVGRRPIYIGTILYTLPFGIPVDASSTLPTTVSGNVPGVPSRIIVLVLGTVAIGFGLGPYQAAEPGIGPADGISQTIMRVIGLPYRVERILLDTVMTAAGWLLGGTAFIRIIVGIVVVGSIMTSMIIWGKKLLYEENPQHIMRREHQGEESMKRMYKRIATAITTVALMFSVAECGQKEVAEDDKLKVALPIMSNLGDKGFYDSVNDGTKLIASELKVEVKTIEIGQDPSKHELYFRDVVEQDWGYIIAGFLPTVEVVKTLIPQYPGKKFTVSDTEVDWSKGDLKNLYCMQYKQNEGDFLVGVVAAVTTTGGRNTNPEKTVGYVGGGGLPIINSFMLGYTRGAQCVEPDIKATVSYVRIFMGLTRGREPAPSQVSQQKVDICYRIASQTGIGVLDVTKELGLYAIGADSDQAATFKDSDPITVEMIVTSMMKRVDRSLFRAIKMTEKDALAWGQTEVAGLKEFGMGIVYGENLEKELSARNQQPVKGLEQKIINGEIVVDSAIGMDTANFAVIRNKTTPQWNS